MKFDFNNTVLIVYFTNGGIMRRLLRLGTLLLAIMLMAGASYAQKPRVQVSGRIAANHVRINLHKISSCGSIVIVLATIKSSPFPKKSTLKPIDKTLIHSISNNVYICAAINFAEIT